MTSSSLTNAYALCFYTHRNTVIQSKKEDTMASGFTSITHRVRTAIIAILVAIVIFFAACTVAVESGEYDSNSFGTAAEQNSESNNAHTTASNSTGIDTADTANTDDAGVVTANIQELLQYPELPAGCESVALTCVLNAMGYDIAATELVANYLPIDPTSSDHNSFLGDPYSSGYAFPPAIIAAATNYFTAIGSSAEARDISGTDFEELLEIVESGTPVLVWSTMYFNEPVFTGLAVGPYATYYNEHCVVLYSFDDDVVYVSDPLDGLVERDRADFQRIYEICGSMAVIIKETS